MSVDDFRPSRFLDSERGFLPAMSCEEFEHRRRVFTERALSTLSTGDIEHAADFTVGSAPQAHGIPEGYVFVNRKWKHTALCVLLAGAAASTAAYCASFRPSALPSEASVHGLELDALSVPAAHSMNESPRALTRSEAAVHVTENDPVVCRAYLEQTGQLTTNVSEDGVEDAAVLATHGNNSGGSPAVSMPSHPSPAADVEAVTEGVWRHFSAHSPSAALVTSPGASSHGLFGSIDPFTALWMVVGALALSVEVFKAIARGVKWCFSGQGISTVVSVCQTLVPQKLQTPEEVLEMSARMAELEQRLNERTSKVQEQNWNYKLMQEEMQRILDKEVKQEKTIKKLQKQLEKERAEKQWALTTPRGTTVVQKPESPANDPATAVLHTSVAEKPSSVSPIVSLKAPPTDNTPSPATKAVSPPTSGPRPPRMSAPPVPTPPLHTPPGPPPPRAGARPPMHPSSFSPMNRRARASSSCGSATSSSRIGADREPSSAALGCMLGRSHSNASTCTDSCIGVALNVPPEGSPASVKSCENPLL